LRLALTLRRLLRRFTPRPRVFCFGWALPTGEALTDSRHIGTAGALRGTPWRGGYDPIGA
jgi:hypothetical protein